MAFVSHLGDEMPEQMHVRGMAYVDYYVHIKKIMPLFVKRLRRWKRCSLNGRRYKSGAP
jgi:hypothetical protein